MTNTTLRFNFNRLSNRGKENFGFLLHFNVNNFHWDLNFRGDAPLMKYMTNGEKHILQIDGDVFHPMSAVMCDPKIEDESKYSDNGGVPERKEETDPHGALAFCH